MGEQEHPRAIFKRAIENGNVLVAEMTARELGRITLAEALALTVLVIEKDPGRRSRYAVRWLRRLLQEARQHRDANRLDAVARAELLVGARQVELDRLLDHEQLPGDGAVGEAVGSERQHLLRQLDGSR